jgi:hypothetical protein
MFKKYSDDFNNVIVIEINFYDNINISINVCIENFAF